MVIARRNLMAGKSLPYLWRVAYLEGTGTQYIDTGIATTSELSLMAKIRVGGGTNEWIFGSRVDATIATFGVLRAAPNVFRWSWGNGGVDSASLYNLLGDIEVTANRNILTYDGHDLSLTYKSFNSDVSLMLFAINLNGTPSTARFVGRFYWAKVYIGSELRRDFIPVLDLSGRPCMYNQAPLAVPADDPSRFFYNQGSGEFTTDLDVQT